MYQLTPSPSSAWDEEAEAQGRLVTCPRSQNKKLLEPGFDTNRLTTRVMFVKVVQGNSASHEAQKALSYWVHRTAVGAWIPSLNQSTCWTSQVHTRAGWTVKAACTGQLSKGPPSHQDLRTLPLSRASGWVSRSLLHILKDFNHDPTKSPLLCNCLLLPFAPM